MNVGFPQSIPSFVSFGQEVIKAVAPQVDANGSPVISARSRLSEVVWGALSYENPSHVWEKLQKFTSDSKLFNSERPVDPPPDTADLRQRVDFLTRGTNRLVQKESLLKQQLELLKSLETILRESNSKESSPNKVALLGRLTSLRAEVLKERVTVCEEAEVHQAGVAIFNNFVLKARPAAVMNNNQPLLAAAIVTGTHQQFKNNLRPTERLAIQVKRLEKDVELTRQALERGLLPGTNEPLTKETAADLLATMQELQEGLAKNTADLAAMRKTELEAQIVKQQEARHVHELIVQAGNSRSPAEVAEAEENIKAIDGKIASLQAGVAEQEIAFARSASIREMIKPTNIYLAQVVQRPQNKQTMANLVAQIKNIDSAITAGHITTVNGQRLDLSQAHLRHLVFQKNQLDLRHKELEEIELRHDRNYRAAAHKAIESSIRSLKMKTKDAAPAIAQRLITAISVQAKQSHQVDKDYQTFNLAHSSLIRKLQNTKTLVTSYQAASTLLTGDFQTAKQMTQMGNYLSAAVDRDIADLAEVYKWSGTEWGQLLKTPHYEGDVGSSADKDTDFANFQNDIHKTKSEIRRLTAQVSAYENAYENVMHAKSTTTDMRVLTQLTKQETELKRELGRLNADLADCRIALRADFMQRMTDGISYRKQHMRALDKEKNECQTLISNIDKQISQIAKPVDRNQLKAERKTQIGRITEIEWEKRDTELQIKALNRGFEKQYERYLRLEQLDRPSSLAEITQANSWGERFNAAGRMALGAVVGRAYVAPQQFRLKLQSANAGYTPQLGIDKLLQLRAKGGDTSIIMIKLIGEFLQWADKHPKAAQAMIADIAITLNFLGQQDVINTLVSGIRARLYARAILGEMGRTTTEEPEITEADFKFLAIGDIMKYGPTGAAAPAVMAAFFQGLGEGGLQGGVAGAIMSAAVEGGRNKLVQNAIQLTDPNHLQFADVALSMARGDSADAILASQRNLGSLRAVGNFKQVIRESRGVVEEGLNRLNTWANTLTRSKGWEQFTRVATTAILPGLGVGAIVAIVIFSGPIGLAGLELAFLLMSIAGGVGTATGICYNACNKVWPANHRAVMRENAQAALEGNITYLTRLKNERNAKIARLRVTGKIPKEKAPKPLGNWKEIEKWLSLETGSPPLTLADRLRQEFTNTLKTKISLKSGLPPRTLTSTEVMAAYNDVVKEFNLDGKCKALCEKLESTIWDKEGLAIYLAHEVLAPLFVQAPVENPGYMVQKLDEGLKYEFCTAVVQYESTQQFKAAEKQILDSCLANAVKDPTIRAEDRTIIEAEIAAANAEAAAAAA